MSDRRDRRRREILDAAKRVFAAKGFHQASISDIIAAAGIARGTFYLYFPGKDAVFASILDQAIRDLRDRIERVDVRPDAPPPREQLEANVGRVLDYLFEDRALVTLLLAHGVAPDLEVAGRVEEFFDHVRDMIESSVRYGLSVGLVRPCDPELVAAAVLGALRGSIRYLLPRGPRADSRRLAHQLLDFALHGVLASDSPLA